MNIQQILDDDNVLNVYRYGSRVYGTDNADSDHDYVVVSKTWFDSENTDIHVFSLDEFKRALGICNISALECIFVDRRHIVKSTIDIEFGPIDLTALRTYISTITSNSYVKGKKKLTVTGDYDLKAGIKSVYHSLRILDYGIQIASSGIIYDYARMNYVLEDLWKMSKDKQGNELWEEIDAKYRKVKNSMSSQFKDLCPKEKVNARSVLNDIIKKHYKEINKEMVDEIIEKFDL